MKLTINGASREFPDGLTLAALVGQLGMKVDRVAVELNLDIAPRDSWEATVLKDGDRLEIVHFVGGGSGPGNALRQSKLDSVMTAWNCPSCSCAAQGNFCSVCGEKHPSRHDLSIGHLLSHAGETLFHWDSKLLRSFRVLLWQPGALTVDYAAGKRRPYVHPFQIFFIANLLYFLLFPLIGWTGLKTPLKIYETMQSYSAWATRMAAHRAEQKGLNMVEFGERFDHVMELQAKSMVLVMVPIFTLALAASEWRKRRYVGEHMAFALHFMAVWLFVYMMLLPASVRQIGRLLRQWNITFTNSAQNHAIFWVAGALLVGYMFVGLRRFYGDGVFAALAKSVALVWISTQILELYRLILFVTTLYSV